MKIKGDKINYRRANIDDIDILVNFRIRFLNEFYKHPEDNETEILKKELADSSFSHLRRPISEKAHFAFWVSFWYNGTCWVGCILIWEVISAAVRIGATASATHWFYCL